MSAYLAIYYFPGILHIIVIYLKITNQHLQVIFLIQKNFLGKEEFILVLNLI